LRNVREHISQCKIAKHLQYAFHHLTYIIVSQDSGNPEKS